MKKLKYIIPVFLFLLANTASSAQATGSIPGKQQPADTTSLLHALKKGKVNGYARYFFMNTINENNLRDYFAHAVSAGIRYESAPFHHFQFALSGYSVFNIGSSELTKKDSITGMPNRYEIQLFDITNPGNKHDINRLEEFYLKYNYKNSGIRIGRQLINTPFINLQDGRMRPTAVSGIWAEINDIRKIKIQAGWLWGISPRSTSRWYSIGNSIGIYPSGLNPDGTKSGYANNTKSNGVGLIQLHATFLKNITLKATNMFVENIFNTTLLQADYEHEFKNKTMLFAALQFIKQVPVNNGGNDAASHAYFPSGNKPITFGARLGWKNNQWEASVNYNRITKTGRYLVPREWGIDPFFTFMPRERNDGLGDVHAIAGKLSHSFPKAGIKASLAAGYYKLPDVKNYTLNKYGLPGYTQINADIRYSFSKMLNGLDAQLLLVSKISTGETYENKQYIFNKVNMIQCNFVLNYHF